MHAKAKAIGATEECPVFEVISGGYPPSGPARGCHDGGIVVAHWHPVFFPHVLFCHGAGEPGGEMIESYDEWVAGWSFLRHELRPLTRAAREMLALVEPCD